MIVIGLDILTSLSTLTADDMWLKMSKIQVCTGVFSFNFFGHFWKDQHKCLKCFENFRLESCENLQKASKPLKPKYFFTPRTTRTTMSLNSAVFSDIGFQCISRPGLATHSHQRRYDSRDQPYCNRPVVLLQTDLRPIPTLCEQYRQESLQSLDHSVVANYISWSGQLSLPSLQGK